jgi:hypothetical protein
MNWPTRIMAPAMGIVASVWVAALLWLHHQPVLLIVGVAIVAGLAVGAFFHVFGRRTGA